MSGTVNIAEACADPGLFGEWLGDLESWAAWMAILKGTFALPMSRSERRTFRKLTQRQPPKRQARELWVAAGRRSGKSAICALIAVFYAALRDHSAVLRAGEKATIFIIAADRAQCRTILRYIRAILDAPLFAGLILSETRETINLRNNIAVEVGTCTHRALRGYSCPLIIADEIAFWRDEHSASPDTEVLASLRPTQATFPNPLLVCISSPYARRGALWSTYKEHFGRDGSNILVVQASSLDLNPLLDKKEIDAELARDPSGGRAEWLGEFRTDIESFVALDAVMDVVVPGRHELPPVAEVAYVGFVDPSGGAHDSMTLAVAHRDCDSGRAVLDCIRERKAPFNPDDVTKEFADLLKRYRCGTVCGDRYAGEWPRERFREHGITYEAAAAPKSDLYLSLLPEINSGQVELLDHDRLVAQLCALERRTARSGKDSIDHGPRGFDDISNAVAGVMSLLQTDVTESLTGAAFAGHSAAADFGVDSFPPAPAPFEFGNHW